MVSPISSIVFDYPTAPPSKATHIHAIGHSKRDSSYHFHPTATAKITSSSPSPSPSSSSSSSSSFQNSSFTSPIQQPIQSNSEPIKVPTRTNPAKYHSSFSLKPQSSDNNNTDRPQTGKKSSEKSTLNNSTIRVTEFGTSTTVESAKFGARKGRNNELKQDDNLMDGLSTFINDNKYMVEDSRSLNISGSALRRSIATPIPNEKLTSKVKTIAPPTNEDRRPNRLAQIPPPIIKEKARGKAKQKEIQPKRPTFATHY